MDRITIMEFIHFQNEYYTGKWPALRFGQAFINRFYPASGEETADIFYEKDSVKVEAAIIDRFVVYED